MRARFITGIVLLAGCGRFGFADREAAGDGAIDVPADAPACTQPSPGDFARWSMPNFTAGLPHAASYTTSPDGKVVRDNVTGLEWQQMPPSMMLSQTEAIDYCAALTLGSNCDWRLPERIELISITDYTRNGTMFNAVVFSGPADVYWSATPELNAPLRAWYVSFTNGIIGSTVTTSPYPVRCVRGGYDIPPAHYTSDALTVADNSTGLVWERDVDVGYFNHAEAMSRCAALTTAGGGWRSPSINELESLVDVTEQSPAIHSLTFPSTPSSLFWSRNIQVGDMSQGWTVNFDDGSVARSLTTALPVRCVR